ncbi:ABC transporter permease [Dinghuibacter silviterrae]|uniref:Putative permease n=1 Tax=Dinghuibacter silviterrae TaxID=1539049 RepID=A0A4R8DT76_9BACT|nr:ABC transporter permease [Dinghuibacter silviterrae]TDX00617.1 putative permease [Dinghuibacter silviterrae]
MLKNIFLTAWRTLRRNRVYTFVNVLGLSLGCGGALLIFSVIHYQLNFDTFHQDADRIYRIVTTFHEENVEHQTGVPQPFGKAFLNEYNFAEQTARVDVNLRALISLPEEKTAAKYEEENGVAYADPGFFDIFHFPLLHGTQMLAEPNTALITARVARKYFGVEDAVGKMIRYDNQRDYKVTGILADLPDNTDRHQEIYLSYANLKDKSPYFASDSSWGNTEGNMQFFVRLRPGVSAAMVDKALPQLVHKYYDPEDAKVTEFSLQPLRDIHFNTTLDGRTDRKYLWALGCIGLFLIVTACVNFVNLATAQALRRAREVGVRKVMGSLRRQLFWQFMAETTGIVLVAFALAYLLAWWGLPFANDLFRTKMTLGPGLWVFLPALLAGVVFLSGAYPALILSRFRPVIALKGKLSQQHIGGVSLRRGLVVLQFTISQVLIISMLVVAHQLRYTVTADLGFNKDAVVLVPIPQDDAQKMHTFLNSVTALSGVQAATLCAQPPASTSTHLTNIRFDNRPKDENWEVNVKAADERYVPTFGLKLVAGRNLFASDTLREFLVNETFLRKLGLTNPDEAIGKSMSIGGHDVPGRIAGVLRDFHHSSLRTGIDPLCVTTAARDYKFCAVKVNMTDWKNTQASIERMWNQAYPAYVYSDQFLDERIARFYAVDNTLLALVEGFACIAIVIGCLGLYGLVSFMTAQRTKEIGVRKVLGAGTGDVLWLFGRELSLLIGLAFVIGAPVAWWAMMRYLQDYTYRIPIGWGTFALSLGATVFIAAATVAWKTARAATANPITSLRSE